MYFLLKMGIFQPAMLVYWRVLQKRLRGTHVNKKTPNFEKLGAARNTPKKINVCAYLRKLCQKHVPHALNPGKSNQIFSTSKHLQTPSRVPFLSVVGMRRGFTSKTTGFPNLQRNPLPCRCPLRQLLHHLWSRWR